MLIRNVTDADLDNALRLTNEVFRNNIEFFSREYAGRTRQGGNKYDVRLTVKNSGGPGGRLSPSGSGRRVKAACWHAHGDFFDSLPAEAEIIVSGEEGIHRPGDSWVDRNIGNQVHPLMFSDACNCSGTPGRSYPRGVKEWRPE